MKRVLLIVLLTLLGCAPSPPSLEYPTGKTARTRVNPASAPQQPVYATDQR